MSAGEEGGLGSCGLEEVSGGGVESPVMEEEPEGEEAGESTIIIIARRSHARIYLRCMFQIQTFLISLRRSESSFRLAHRCTSVNFSSLHQAVL